MLTSFLRRQSSAVLLLLPCLLTPCVSAHADSISPRIIDQGVEYSSEKPNTAYFGTGVTGRMSEASALRFEGERDTQDGHFDLALKKLAKAVQLDPSDPASHLLYARAISAKIFAPNSDVSPELVAKGIAEWKLLWHHDADASEQLEARLQARRLSRVAKLLNKELKRQHNGSSERNMVAQRQPPTQH